MNTHHFLSMLDKLKLTKASKRGAELFGLSLVQFQRITGGKAPVPRPVALLAIAYTKMGLPTTPWNPDVDYENRDAWKYAPPPYHRPETKVGPQITPPPPPVLDEPPKVEPKSPVQLRAEARKAKMDRDANRVAIRLKRHTAQRR